MRRVRNVLSLSILVGMTLLPIHAASAENFAVSGGSITVQSKVAETHYILIDEKGAITQITSNSTEEAQPRVFFQRVALGNERPMSDEVYRQYQAIIPSGKTSHVGTVYKQSEIARLPLFSTPHTRTTTDLLAFITQ